MSNVGRKRKVKGVSRMGIIGKWVKTMRLQTALVTSVTLWAGYISVSSMRVTDAVVLGFAGVAFHVFGFTLNEVKDSAYDANIDNGSYHPVAEGDVDRNAAKYIAWGAYTLSLLVPLAFGYSILATIVMALAVIPAYAYNLFSKEHWWSNSYMSVWAAMMVLAGALYAGSPNAITVAIAGALSVQSFAQAIQGGLKDIVGDESSLCKKMGVKITKARSYLKDELGVELSGDKAEINNVDVVSYTKKFTALIYVLKTSQIAFLATVAYVYVDMALWEMRAFTLAFFVLVVIFFTTLSMTTVYVYDRDRIKKASSVHELTTLVLLGLTLYTLDPHGGLLVGLAPMVWYLAVNKTVHSGALNPDI